MYIRLDRENAYLVKTNITLQIQATSSRLLSNFRGSMFRYAVIEYKLERVLLLSAQLSFSLDDNAREMSVYFSRCHWKHHTRNNVNCQLLQHMFWVNVLYFRLFLWHNGSTFLLQNTLHMCTIITGNVI